MYAQCNYGEKNQQDKIKIIKHLVVLMMLRQNIQRASTINKKVSNKAIKHNPLININIHQYQHPLSLYCKLPPKRPSLSKKPTAQSMQNCRHSSIIFCARFKQTDKLAALIQTHKRSLVCNNTGLYIAVSPFICNILFFFYVLHL